jgi:hypothetical protein
MPETVETQLKNLRAFATPRNQARSRMGCLGVIALGIIGLLAASFYMGVWVLIPFVLFLVILGLGINHSIRQLAPRLSDAHLALDRHEAVRDSLRIVVVQGSDSDEYHAGMLDRQGRDWRFEFNPAGWIPKTGDYPAELRFVDGVEWPVLIVTEAGILYPKYAPTRDKLDFPVAEESGPSRPLPYYLGGAISLLLAGLILAGVWGTYLNDSRIEREAATVDAVVVRAGFLVAKPGETHGLIYRFNLPDGRAMERRWSEDDDRWRGYRAGDRIRIHYDPNDPNRNFPDGEGVTSLGMTLFISAFGLAFLFLAGMLMLGGYRLQAAARRA